MKVSSGNRTAFEQFLFQQVFNLGKLMLLEGGKCCIVR